MGPTIQFNSNWGPNRNSSIPITSISQLQFANSNFNSIEAGAIQSRRLCEAPVSAEGGSPGPGSSLRLGFPFFGRTKTKRDSRVAGSRHPRKFLAKVRQGRG